MTSYSSLNQTVAVIGAGLSGLACAQRLQDFGFDVTSFEKSRGKGGRMSTRRNTEGLFFDHGAQYFTVRDQTFQHHVEEWSLDGIVSLWDAEIGTLSRGHFEPKDDETLRYVGVPGMNELGRYLARDLDIHLNTLVAPPQRIDGHWQLSDDQSLPIDEFDYVVTSAPAAQSAKLLVEAPVLQSIAENVVMTGCWAVMLAFSDSLGLSFDGAFIEDSPLSWISKDSSKPGREENPETWVLHASPEWSESHLEELPEDVLPKLLAAFWQATGVTPCAPVFQTAHRWRYALPTEPLPDRFLFDAEKKIGACGDWCGGPRVEGAFLSGYSLANEILASVQQVSS